MRGLRVELGEIEQAIRDLSEVAESVVVAREDRPGDVRLIAYLVPPAGADAAQRAEIWRRVFPRETPTLDLEADKLARLSVPGGNIRNIALYAAFLAANEGSPVRMAHLVRATRAEFLKLERPLTEAEIGSWA